MATTRPLATGATPFRRLVLQADSHRATMLGVGRQTIRLIPPLRYRPDPLRRVPDDAGRSRKPIHLRQGSSPKGRNGNAGSSAADEPGPKEMPNPSCQRTCPTIRLPWGNGRSSSLSGRVKSSHAFQSVRSKTTTWRLWIGAISGPGSVVRSVKLPGTSPCAGRHNPAKQNQSSPALVNRHFDFGDFVPVNSKKCEAGTRHLPLQKRRPSDLKLITGGAFARPGRKPHRSCASSTPSAWR